MDRANQRLEHEACQTCILKPFRQAASKVDKVSAASPAMSSPSPFGLSPELVAQLCSLAQAQSAVLPMSPTAPSASVPPLPLSAAFAQMQQTKLIQDSLQAQQRLNQQSACLAAQQMLGANPCPQGSLPSVMQAAQVEPVPNPAEGTLPEPVPQKTQNEKEQPSKESNPPHQGPLPKTAGVQARGSVGQAPKKNDAKMAHKLSSFRTAEGVLDFYVRFIPNAELEKAERAAKKRILENDAPPEPKPHAEAPLDSQAEGSSIPKASMPEPPVNMNSGSVPPEEDIPQATRPKAMPSP